MTDHGSPAGPPAEQRPIEMDFVPFDESSPDADGQSPPPSRLSRGRLIVLGSLLAVGLTGAAVLGTAGYRIISQKDATVSTPEQVGGLRREDGEDARSTAEYLRNALSAEVDLDETVGAVYTDAAGADRSVLFFGGTTLVWTPERDLDTAFELLSDDTGAVTGLRDVPAGDFGGTMKCGSTASPDGDIAVCGWADHGSLALAMFPNRPPDDAAVVLLAIRDAAQTRE
ncbi:MAG TPA: hypothetical protein VF657_20375 [Actinoplanes sp.]|jgi:hypothetical protein